MRTVNIRLGKKVIRAKVADSFLTRAKGLMFRKGMEEDEGMIFVFKKECFPRFWMVGMRFPIDMLWIDNKKRIVDRTLNVKPSWDLRKTYKPRRACKYVLEVKAGLAKKIKTDRVSFEI